MNLSIKSSAVILKLFKNQIRYHNYSMFSSKKPETTEQKQDMKNPYPSKKCPMNIELEAGKQYWYCACGLSNNQPFCDGSHKDTPYTPIPFTAKNQKYHSICLCRQSDALPFCDGTHNDIAF